MEISAVRSKIRAALLRCSCRLIEIVTVIDDIQDS